MFNVDVISDTMASLELEFGRKRIRSLAYTRNCNLKRCAMNTFLPLYPARADRAGTFVHHTA